MQSYLQNLNEVQRKAVTTVNGPVMVIAGPGSGKTRVLTYRIAHLIEEGVPPWQILALTFTNKAAREMQERIGKVVGDKAREVWAGTFHSLFSRILRIEAEKIGYPSNFTIYDSEDTKNVIKTVIKDLRLNPEKYNVNSCRSRISSAKTNLIPPKAYVENKELMMQDRQNRRPDFHKIYAEYATRCKRSGAMDFDDLLYRLYELLHRNPDNVLEKYRERFRFLLVDEFQDTNYLQYAIVKKLTRYPDSPRNVCIVGDDAQSIYAFRGATIENILNFQKDFSDAKIYKLEQNYRSTEQIVQTANTVISNNQKQIPKKIWSDKGDGKKIQLIKAVSDTEEGKRVADTIVELKTRNHLSNSDIAILYRTNAQSRIFEEYLRRYNLTYRVFGGLSFYQRKEVKDMIAYLRLAVNPHDDEALRRVINYPKRGIGKASVEKISEHAAQVALPLWEAIPQVSFPTRTRSALDRFRQCYPGSPKESPEQRCLRSGQFYRQTVRAAGCAERRCLHRRPRAARKL
jgi:DNA helicase-2/ATP-dependent DNA helicase PcrA